MTGLRRTVAGLWVLCLICLLPGSAKAAARVALVIGNGAYQAMSSLANPVNDANLMAGKLSGLGFDVIRVIDGDRRGFYDALTQFGRKAQGAEVALVFYAGHGVQVNGRNWLLPVDAQIQASTDLPGQAVKADDLLEIMEASGARLKLVFLDACRNNPLPRSLSRGTSNGLARLEASAAGMMIAFATSPGDIALDGTGSNSPFTEALATWIDTPDLEVRHLMGRVRESVYRATGEAQLPWLNEALIGEFYFGGRSNDTDANSSHSSANSSSVAPPPQSNETVSTGPTLSLQQSRHQPAPRYAGSLCNITTSWHGNWQVCASSVLDPQYGNRYGALNLLDGNASTAWVEGVGGNGAGESILIAFDRPRLLSGFDIVNGYAKNRDIYSKNARLQTARITLSDGSTQTISLPDSMRSNRFAFGAPVEASWIEIEIGSVYPGAKYTDTALSEFTPVFAD
ncbi:NADase-type glycan-binding domain-containing protein [Roseibium sp. SCP14]|uniref:NADase-type glycan-binding domain-containing protein n=1 Tax=Roseibium sp. SCP14 TaxID=3141375 RepID=UPI003338A453